jgi:hypothetical protein
VHLNALRIPEHSLAGRSQSTVEGYGVGIMGNRGLVLDGNAGGTPTDNSGETVAVLRLALVAAGLVPAGATLRLGR